MHVHAHYSGVCVVHISLYVMHIMLGMRRCVQDAWESAHVNL
jgi:hypothetical protein